MIKKNKFCVVCIEYPNKYTKYKCRICKTLCCPHNTEMYETMDNNDELDKIEYYWHIFIICHDCIKKILINVHEKD